MQNPDSDNKQKSAWYCLHTQPKREHIAAANIRSRVELEVFCPRVTYYKKTQWGRVRFTEALFPRYIFVQCDIARDHRHLLSIAGVQSFVCYGSEIPSLPDSFIKELKIQVPEECRESPEPELNVGTEVEVIEGPFKDIKAIVSGQLPATRRVSLLLEFLGRQIAIELPTQDIMASKREPKSFFTKPS